MDRRGILKLALGFAVGGVEATLQARSTAPIIDTHIHLFDPMRTGGVPWPPKDDAVLYKPALPSRYEHITRPLGVVGAIVVEASPLESDNDWVLQQAADHTIVVGLVGDLIPGTSSYGRELDRLHANPLLVGIRYGNLWDRDLAADWKKPGFVSDLRKLASAGLVLDSANPDPKLIRAILDVSQQVPELRVVIDHLPAVTVPTESGARKQYWANLQSLSQNARVFVKLSQVPARVASSVPKDVSFYKDKLDGIWDVFGEDHVLFGSDWPNSDHVATYAETLDLVRSYVATKGSVASDKYFWRNSIVAYGWRPRNPDQPAA
ncbi:MAG TPA: amidohydrolase family protein [Terriglobales bacterium]|jgi:L-fuconolactonase|nr:amidohydrolase family protein [Terriglobales bacterium]